MSLALIGAFLKSRIGEWVIIAALITGAALYAHHHIVVNAKSEQQAADQKSLDKALAAEKKAKDGLATYVAQYKKFVADTAAGVAQQAATQKIVDAETAAELAAANARAAPACPPA